ARTLVEQVLPTPTEDQQIEALKAAIAEAHRHGITSVQDVQSTGYQLELYEDLRRDDELKVRVYGFVEIPPEFNPASLDLLDRIQKTYPDDPLLKAGAVRLTLDGSLETQTAAMLAPYATRPRSNGQLLFSADELSKIVAALDRTGWQIAIEAAGDAAVRAALDAFEQASRVNPPPARGRRHRIERIDAVDASDAGRFKTGGIVASLQPQRAFAPPDPLHLRALNPGAERAPRGWSWTPIAEAGGIVAFGSDWPIGALDPLAGVQVAMAAGSPVAAESDSDRRIRLTNTLDAYTRGAAYASFDEQRKGTLARGMLADLVILSTDIFSLPPDRLSDARVEYTIFDGKVVYSRERETTDK
ncbi:MAG: amidohydrolase family protein, partial [Acidobacteria bacterium]|nr:amidohydrolase family protein [Acidobacteriota bacterium]